jgi:hypothetical protein
MGLLRWLTKPFTIQVDVPVDIADTEEEVHEMFFAGLRRERE